jgi:transmembrane protein 18
MADYDVVAGVDDAAFDESGGASAAAAAAATATRSSGVVSGSVAVDASSSTAPPQAQLQQAVDATVSELLREMRRHADVVRAEGRGFADMVSGFIAAVDWRNDAPWLLALGAAHLFAAVAAVRHRGSPRALSLLFAGGCAAVLLGEKINGFASQHWRLFATQDYFDPRGVFYSAVVGMPVLLNLVLVVAMYLLQCAALLAQAKGAQLRRAAARGGGAAAASGGGRGKAKAASTPARRRAGGASTPGAAAATPRPRTRSQANSKGE